MTSQSPPELLLAVPTYRRPEEIAALVPALLGQLDSVQRAGVARGRLLVVDNDPAGGARSALTDWLSRLTYVVEAQAGISAARNRALDEAHRDDLLVFIDDDERPSAGWLEHLIRTHRESGAAAVAGPVRSLFEGELDPWIRASGLFERRYRVGLATGTPIVEAATNNLLLDLRVVRALDLRFAAELGLTGGEDSLFTRSLSAAGAPMVWCAEAEVTEVVPPHRLSRRWVVQRQLRSGNSAVVVDLHVARSGRARWQARAGYVVGGSARLLGGLARTALGLLTHSRVHQARGTRLAVRGLGMLGGALGWRYREYARPAGERVGPQDVGPRDPAVGSTP